MAQSDGDQTSVRTVVSHRPNRVLVVVAVAGVVVTLIVVAVLATRSGTEPVASPPSTSAAASSAGSLPQSLLTDMASTAEVFRWEDKGGMVSPNVDEAKFPLVGFADGWFYMVDEQTGAHYRLQLGRDELTRFLQATSARVDQTHGTTITCGSLTDSSSARVRVVAPDHSTGEFVASTWDPTNPERGCPAGRDLYEDLQAFKRRIRSDGEPWNPDRVLVYVTSSGDGDTAVPWPPRVHIPAALNSLQSAWGPVAPFEFRGAEAQQLTDAIATARRKYREHAAATCTTGETCRTATMFWYQDGGDLTLPSGAVVSLLWRPALPME